MPMCKTCSVITIKTQEQCCLCCSGVFIIIIIIIIIIIFEQILHVALKFALLTLIK